VAARFLLAQGPAQRAVSANGPRPESDCHHRSLPFDLAAARQAVSQDPLPPPANGRHQAALFRLRPFLYIFLIESA